MKKTYKISLLRLGIFDHNVYISCENIEKTKYSKILVDGEIEIDFILEIGKIIENKWHLSPWLSRVLDL